MKIIARIYTDFKEKFGIPRQSGIVENTKGKIVFEKEYRNDEALRGIDGYSHLWLIWQFSEAIREDWSPTVRPPRLGGNKRMGVFATRSPFRPNPIGLSSVKLLDVFKSENEGTVLIVEGADIMNGTPIYDIKPYLAYTDSHPDAVGGFADNFTSYKINVDISEEFLRVFREDEREAVLAVLAHDPRPSYKNDPDRIYGMKYADYDIYFKVKDDVLTVTGVEKQKK